MTARNPGLIVAALLWLARPFRRRRPQVRRCRYCGEKGHAR